MEYHVEEKEDEEEEVPIDLRNLYFGKIPSLPPNKNISDYLPPNSPYLLDKSSLFRHMKIINSSIQSLPRLPRTFGKNLQPEFLNGRRAILNEFFQYLCYNWYLSNHRVVRRFLEVDTAQNNIGRTIHPFFTNLTLVQKDIQLGEFGSRMQWENSMDVLFQQVSSAAKESWAQLSTNFGRQSSGSGERESTPRRERTGTWDEEEDEDDEDERNLPDLVKISPERISKSYPNGRSSHEKDYEHGTKEEEEDEKKSSFQESKDGRVSYHDFKVTDQSQRLRACWNDVTYDHSFSVRGLNYMEDRVKFPAGNCMGRLLRCDFFYFDQEDPDDTNGRRDHIVTMGKCKENLQALRDSIQEPMFYFLANFQIPGTPPISIVAYFGLALSGLLEERPGLPTQKFLNIFHEYSTLPLDIPPSGELPYEDFRNARFKLIPSIREGPQIIKLAVGNKPALLGRKLTARYFRGEDYLELDIDIGSSIIASRVVSLCRDYCNAYIVDIGLLVQGECEEELPERLIGCVQLAHIDLSVATPLHPTSP